MKALVILSGGMDSATVLAYAKTIHEEVETLTFNYGSKHNERENRSAVDLSDHFQVKNQIVKLPFVNELFKSDLLKSGGEIPEGHYADVSMKRTVVPFRNGIMLSIAAGYAESIGAKAIYLGAHAGDHAIYPDCRPEWTQAMAKAILLGGYGEVALLSPFVEITKAAICRLGAKLMVPFEKTYSCYKGEEKHCGKCGTCVERKEAFDQADIIDPTPYSG